MVYSHGYSREVQFTWLTPDEPANSWSASIIIISDLSRMYIESTSSIHASQLGANKLAYNLESSHDERRAPIWRSFRQAPSSLARLRWLMYAWLENRKVSAKKLKLQLLPCINYCLVSIRKLRMHHDFFTWSKFEFHRKTDKDTKPGTKQNETKGKRETAVVWRLKVRWSSKVRTKKPSCCFMIQVAIPCISALSATIYVHACMYSH